MNRRRFLQFLGSLPVAGSIPAPKFLSESRSFAEKEISGVSASEWFTLPADHLPQSLRDNFAAVRKCAYILQKMQSELGSSIKLKPILMEQGGLENGADALGYWQLSYPRIIDTDTKETVLSPLAVAQAIRQSLKPQFTDSVRFLPIFDEGRTHPEIQDRYTDIVVADYAASDKDLAMLDTCSHDQGAMKSLISKLDYTPDHLVPVVHFRFEFPA